MRWLGGGLVLRKFEKDCEEVRLSLQAVVAMGMVMVAMVL